MRYARIAIALLTLAVAGSFFPASYADMVNVIVSFPDITAEQAAEGPVVRKIEIAKGEYLIFKGSFTEDLTCINMRIDYDNKKFFESVTEKHVTRKVKVKDEDGQTLVFEIYWTAGDGDEKVWNDRCQVIIETGKKPGEDEKEKTCTLKDAEGHAVQIKFSYSN